MSRICRKLSALFLSSGLALGLTLTLSTLAGAQPPAAGGRMPSLSKPPVTALGVESPEDAVINAATWDQKMDAQVPLDVSFQDESGREVRLKEYFNGKPVVLVLVFYNCTMLCTEVMNGTTRAVQELKFLPGRDYEIVTISIDDRETPALAKSKKKLYLEEAARPGAEKGWHFLTGSKANIKTVADSVGFHYEYDPRSDSFAHPNGITILTPRGKVSNYMMGIDYPGRDLRFNLIKAADNKIGSPVDQLLLTCFHYNPTNGKYTLSIMRVMRLAAIATMALLGMAVIGAVRAGKKSQDEASTV